MKCHCFAGFSDTHCHKIKDLVTDFKSNYSNLMPSQSTLIMLLTLTLVCFIMFGSVIIRRLQIEEKRVERRSLHRKLTGLCDGHDRDRRPQGIPHRFSILTRALMKGFQMPTSILLIRSRCQSNRGASKRISKSGKILITC